MAIVERLINGKALTIETGKMAKQAGGSVVVRYGETVVLVAATGSKEPREGIDYFPLTVDYVEKTFAAGKIPGGFFKREGRPSEQAILTSRFIDRPIRPLFKDGYNNDTQVIATVLSADCENEPDVLAMIGASSALMLSPVPFLGPIAGVCVGRVNGEFKINPTNEELEHSDIDLIVAGSRDAVVMVEGGSKEVPEKDIVAAIMFAHKQMQPILDMQEELQKMCGQPKWEVTPPKTNPAVLEKVAGVIEDKLEKVIRIPTKMERYSAIDDLKKEVKTAFKPQKDSDEDLTKEAIGVFEEMKKTAVRQMIMSEKTRIDGRGCADIRKITIEAGLLPRTHGSALFTRGETQALAVATLGTYDDQQRIDSISGEYFKRFMLHYNFPPYSVGETKPQRSPGRREIGHGALAERAIKGVLPEDLVFPYTIRVVSEILESNGSSSMATVCGTIIALMDAGVPISAPVAGIAMGLIAEGDQFVILSDILGDEDHLGDMDFKVCGTAKGVTALQMDIKIAGITEDILSKALHQALEGRNHILGKMAEAMDKPRAEVSKYAPKIQVITIAKETIGALIGPGGKNIRNIQETTGAKIDIDDDGIVYVSHEDLAALKEAVRMVKGSTSMPEVGKYYRGTVQKIMDFGAFIEILPNTDGLCHISQLDTKRVNVVTDVLKEGDEVVVKVIGIEEGSGKIKLSRKEALGHENEVEE